MDEMIEVATDRQVAANRRNASRSTGPKTEKGKRASAQNAIRHGLLANTAFVPKLDDREEWEEFRDALLADLRPVGALEQILAERTVAVSWRLARVGRYERDMIRKELADAEFFDRTHGFDEDDESSSPLESKSAQNSLGNNLGILPDETARASIGRYESQLHRTFMQCLHELQRIQARRRGDAADVPVAVDVNLTGPPEPMTTVDDPIDYETKPIRPPSPT